MKSTEIMHIIRGVEKILEIHDQQRNRLMDELRDLSHQWEQARNEEGIPLEQWLQILRDRA